MITPMHWHELLEQVAALVLVTSGTFFLAAAWLARRKVPPSSCRTDGGVRTIAVVPVIGVVALAAVLAVASAILEPGETHHDGAGTRPAGSSLATASES